MKKTKLLENVARIYYHFLAPELDVDELPEGAIDSFDEMRELRVKSQPSLGARYWMLFIRSKAPGPWLKIR